MIPMKKKGVSLMVAYVLLVVIAISLSALVYIFLKSYLPTDKVECPSDLSLIIEGARCIDNKNNLTINISNKGFSKRVK